MEMYNKNALIYGFSLVKNSKRKGCRIYDDIVINGQPVTLIIQFNRELRLFGTF